MLILVDSFILPMLHDSSILDKSTAFRDAAWFRGRKPIIYIYMNETISLHSILTCRVNIASWRRSDSNHETSLAGSPSALLFRDRLASS
jgi:hypothetical protein